MTTSCLKGLLLAGGYSTRMGQDKAFLRYNGQPVYQHLANILAAAGLAVYISCRKEQKPLFDDYPTISDIFTASGPLTGLISAFIFDPEASWLVIPVDMPNLSSHFLKECLIDQRDRMADATIIFDQNNTSLQPLVGIYEASSYPTILQQFQAAQFSVKNLLAKLRVHQVSFTDHQNILVNLNTQSDWQKLK